MPAADDKQLVRRARRGDEKAFRALMEKYRRKIYAIAYGMVRDPEVAMDISQEVFIKVHRYLGSFQGSSSFYTWLYRIVVNLSIDHIRKERKHESVDYDDMILRREPDDDESWIVPTVLDSDPHEAYQRKEMAERIGRAFESLSEKHRAVLILREVEGQSYEEIARVLRIHKGTVMSRLHHARKNFQRALNRQAREGREARQARPEPAVGRAEAPGA
ncbi:MAG: sigma-70 family RNA polymerase sigma factor [Deltaproteobacteria bacterium]|nr:sigma-70 family RNA polymerase sigma factor [Deltaproteobacteria bacterium]